MRKLRFHLALALCGIVGSILYVLIYWSVVFAEIRRTPFFQLLRLIDTDSDILFANLKDLVLGLLETIPIESLFFGSLALFCLIAVLTVVSTIRHERRRPILHSNS